MEQRFIDNKVEILHHLHILIKELENLDYEKTGNWFLCNRTSDYARSYIKSQKPNSWRNTEFATHPRFVGDYVWWNYYLEELDGDMNSALAKKTNLPGIIEEKIRFVNHIINKLEKA